MALTSVQIHFLPTSLRDQIDHFFSSLGQGMNAYMERRSHMSEIIALNEMTDQELAKLGITRDEIPRYVFRDIFYI